ncbi:DNA-directed RNA polymerase specialized sigma24 family protein [Actinoplanes campanulatus]|uniref:DNA-directed RNA polymerase specialized sigma24 family protein n=1 Tax=Actinoplanes campanulatus TaxID=113559 RepID=A0A7W5FIP5_9ACTN|nr:DNA-directed RNA polymerase specialized sigma24 family protein [Actinoplanes campanulatus]GGN47964.1 hypothetical protein GCM10010109_84720 [Actinoplanes campanulatus]GID40439.1 hypothetical protein Aca09nite_69450 [Actinoplanes campanulatus]
MSDREADFREFVGARMESLRGLAYLTCGDWQVAEDAVLSALAKLYAKWNRVENPDAYARTAVVRAAIDETRRPWWRREQSRRSSPGVRRRTCRSRPRRSARRRPRST